MLVVSELSNHHDGDMFVKQPAACWTLMPWNRGSPFHTDPRCRQGGGSITSLTSLGETTDETNWEKDAQRRNHAIIKHQKKVESQSMILASGQQNQNFARRQVLKPRATSHQGWLVTRQPHLS